MTLRKYTEYKLFNHFITCNHDIYIIYNSQSTFIFIVSKNVLEEVSNSVHMVQQTKMFIHKKNTQTNQNILFNIIVQPIVLYYSFQHLLCVEWTITICTKQITNVKLENKIYTPYALHEKQKNIYQLLLIKISYTQ